MELLERQNTYHWFLERLRRAPERILLLDYDGTLAPFNPDRDRAFPYPGIPELVQRIIDLGTRVALITGRPAAELVPLCGLNPHPEIWGGHGLEHLTAAGEYSVGALDPNQKKALLAAAEAIHGNGFVGRLERKSGSVAVHWRGLPMGEVGAMRNQVLQAWIPLAAHYSLKIVNFDGGIEILAPAANKGNAIQSIIEGHNPEAAVAYLGDDQTDEDAFQALKGRGLSILVRSEPRPTAADLRLQPPKQLIEFLHEWLLACGGSV